jgi:tRNA (guanine-N7-)-methyltransferase
VGRRALRKINPQLDLSAHFRRLEEVPCPLTGSALFGRQAPLEFEMGSGKGLFLRTATVARPDVDFLGVEIAVKYAQFAAAGLVKAGVRNGMVVQGDGVRLMAEFIPADSLHAVHVYFPDPWWKKRHRRRRVMREEFLRAVERALRPGGALHFWTDVEEYFQTTLALIAECTTLEGPLGVAETAPQHDLDYRTHFERRVRQTGQAVYRSEFRKACPASANPAGPGP